MIYYSSSERRRKTFSLTFFIDLNAFELKGLPREIGFIHQTLSKSSTGDGRVEIGEKELSITTLAINHWRSDFSSLRNANGFLIGFFLEI